MSKFSLNSMHTEHCWRSYHSGEKKCLCLERSEPHAANPNPHDPANPTKLYLDENGVYIYAKKDQYGNLIPAESELEQELCCGCNYDLETMKQREQAAFNAGWDALANTLKPTIDRAKKLAEKGKPE